MNLRYLIGDATQPIVKPAVIAHVCNDKGRWGKGFVLALSKINKSPEQAYLKWFDQKDSQGVPFALGSAQLIKYEGLEILVANMIAQHDTKTIDDVPPIRYDALKRCLFSINGYMAQYGYTLHVPRLGSGLAGGEWSMIESIICSVVKVDTFVYTLESEMHKWPSASYVKPLYDENNKIVDWGEI